MQPDYPNWVEVNLSAVEENTRLMARISGVTVMAVLKADAYGHGAVIIARTALAAGVKALAVARYGEARVLRSAGIDAPLLVFGMATADEVDEAAAAGVTLTVHSRESADLYEARARETGRRLQVHFKVDTGLGRMGVLPGDAPALARRLWESPHLELEGVYSHMAMVDEAPHPLTDMQIDRFGALTAELEAQGIRPRWVHLGNTTAATDYPRSRFNLVRVGCGIVGIKPMDFGPFPVYLRRSLVWKTRLAACKLYPAGWGVSYGQEYICKTDEWIGTLPLGYADGFHRGPGNQVLIDGRRVPVVGRVCMDACMVRLDRPYPMGTEVVILGEQGGQSIWPEDLCDSWNATEVGITSGIHFRVPRVYVRD